MSENNQNNGTKTDEIDLLDLFRRMGITLTNWAHALGRAFLISLFFMIKRWLPLTLSLILGVGASYFLKYTSQPFYQSELIIRPNAITTGEIYERIKKIQNYILENNAPAISISLFLKPEEAKNLLGIAALWFIDRGKDGIPDYIDYDNSFNPKKDTTSIRMIDRQVIYVRVANPQELPTLRDGILKYLNSDSLYQKKNKLRISQNKEMMNRLNYDIVQLDSLQKILYFQETKMRQPKEGGQMIFLQDQKTQLLYNDVHNLLIRKQSIDTELDLYKDVVTVLSDFSIPIKRMNGGLLYGKKIIPAFFLIALLILILLANRGKLKEVYKKY